VTSAALLAFARCAGFAFRAPGFSHPSVPPPVRAALAFALAPLLARGVADGHVPEGAVLPFAVGAETALGVALGTAASLLYDGAYAGGRLVDDYIGIRAAVPAAGITPANGFGRLWSLAFTAGFFTLGGYALALGALADSFATLPPGAMTGAHQLRAFAVALPALLVRAALFVGGPAFACAFAAQIALAVLARVVPRLSPFTLSFGVAFAFALAATLASLPALAPAAAHPWLVPFAVGR
jgi:flagellar biosynthesis protein FliR